MKGLTDNVNVYTGTRVGVIGIGVGEGAIIGSVCHVDNDWQARLPSIGASQFGALADPLKAPRSI
jgi:hypothetical protein